MIPEIGAGGQVGLAEGLRGARVGATVGEAAGAAHLAVASEHALGAALADAHALRLGAVPRQAVGEHHALRADQLRGHDHTAGAAPGAVAIAPSNPDVIWVGTGEGNPRNSHSSGKGVYRSIDGGASRASTDGVAARRSGCTR